MPYKHETNGKLLRSIGKDRRIKLSEKDKQDIKDKYLTGMYSIRGLAREYQVDKRNIQFLLFPERLEQAKRTLEARGGSKIYYDRIKNNRAIRNTRRYRHKIYQKDKG